MEGESKTRFATSAQAGAWPDCRQLSLTNVYQVDLDLGGTGDLVLSRVTLHRVKMVNLNKTYSALIISKMICLLARACIHVCLPACWGVQRQVGVCTYMYMCR